MYSCQEHIEEVLDECLEDEGKLPILTKIVGKHLCEICGGKAYYHVDEGTMRVEYE